jgi:hypothetical protein
VIRIEIGWRSNRVVRLLGYRKPFWSKRKRRVIPYLSLIVNR